ncbi:MAG: biotin-dependent carboxyltransferase [Alphaproteobacteria bacterium]|nr:biotin-dependent carboxyltransferase [Alphaproteobacteria bacterium]
MSPSLRLVEAFPAMTLQDLGRFGFQRFGVPPAGAIDAQSLQAANMIVGNAPGMACIEITLRGGSFALDAESARVAVAGGQFPVSVNGAVVGPWRSVLLRRGDRLSIGMAFAGVRGYLAVEGGFAVEPFMGSHSSYLRAGMMSLPGQPLASGAVLPLARAAAEERPEVALPVAELRRPEDPMRVVLGPQDDYFSREGVRTFLSRAFRIAADSDRMGYRLSGPTIQHARSPNVVSDGSTFGSVQVPGAGHPIILMVDRGTTGGYPKIATVIGADLPRLAQRRPGEFLRFQAVSIEEAHAALLLQRSWIDGIPRRLLPVDAFLPRPR